MTLRTITISNLEAMTHKSSSKLRSLLVLTVFILGFFSTGKPAPVYADTADIWPSSVPSTDNTGDILADILADDSTTEDPDTLSKAEDDNVYTVDMNKTLYFDAFDTSGIVAGSSVSGAVLHLQYGAEDGYNGTNSVRFDNGGGLTNTTITPSDITGWSSDLTYNLYNQGVDSLSELAALVIEFTSSDGVPPDAIHYDYLYITVTYTLPYITVSVTGTQTSSIYVNRTNNYVGGAWTLVRSADSTTVTQIIISETDGTFSANADLSNLDLYYETAGTCSYDGGESLFNGTPASFDGSDQATASGTMTVGTSQVCLYAVVDVDSTATPSETFDLQITNPSTQVTATTGTVSPATAQAISGSTTIIAGVLSADIVDSGGTPVGSPSVAMTGLTVSFVYQTPTGTFGTSSERIRITNTTASPQWTLTVAADGGSTDFWDGTSADYDFNDPTANAEDGGDGDSFGGQLTVDASGSTVTPEGGCSNTGITKGSSSSFSEGVTDSITLLSAGVTADTFCYWDQTGIGLSQTVPAEQPVGYYSISFTLTITAV